MRRAGLAILAAAAARERHSPGWRPPGAHGRAVADPLERMDELADATALKRPLAWVHVPKTGTTFLNTLSRSVCEPPHATLHPGDMQHDFWETRGDLSRCAFTSATLGGYKSPPGHKGFGSYAAAAKKGATVLRRPEQRVISGFHDGFHSYHGKDEPDLPAYAAAVEGCAVRMLARKQKGSPCGAAPAPTPAEEAAARKTLEAFQFVGITEEWDLTVCLWHATFGPKTCHPSEFTNTRVGAAAEGGADSHEYDEAPLDGFRDRFDGPLYDRAAQLFWAAVAKKDLDREFCDDWKAACLKHAAEHPTPEPPPRPRAEATPGIEVLIGSCLASLSAVVFCVVGAQLMVRRRRRSAVADEIEMESFLQREQGLG